MIKGPKNAVPTLRGWVSPKGELLKCQKITQEQIDEWNGVTAPAPAPQPEPVVVEAEPEVLVQDELEAAPEPPPVAVAAPKTNKFAQAINRAKSKIGK